MKFALVWVVLICFLSGCSNENQPMDMAMDLRNDILNAKTCTFDSVITADYEDKIYTFQMTSTFDSAGKLRFQVSDPETISGITGEISDERAALTFDDAVLAFPMLTDQELSPVSAPWVFINALQGGYLNGSSREAEGICIYIDDSFERNALRLEVYTDENIIPIWANIIWDNRRILSLDIKNFTLQ